MKKYYKVNNESFSGFYDEDMINDIDNFKEISSDEWQILAKKSLNGYELLIKNEKLIAYMKPECKEKYVKKTFNYETELWEEGATLEEQIEYYKNLIIQKTREHELLKVSGFIGTQEEINLKTEIENLKQIYMDKNHELALQIENRLREV